jgi:hypothetical protein
MILSAKINILSYLQLKSFFLPMAVLGAYISHQFSMNMIEFLGSTFLGLISVGLGELILPLSY